MNNQKDLKKVGLITTGIASIVLVLFSIFIIIKQSSMYGVESGIKLIPYYMKGFIFLAVPYYFSTKNIIGSIIGIIYAIYGMAVCIVGVNIIVFITYLILCIGYVLLLIHYVNDKKISNMKYS